MGQLWAQTVPSSWKQPIPGVTGNKQHQTPLECGVTVSSTRACTCTGNRVPRWLQHRPLAGGDAEPRSRIILSGLCYMWSSIYSQHWDSQFPLTAISGLTPMEGILLTMKWKKIKIYSMENTQMLWMVESATHHATCLFFYHRSKHVSHHTSEPGPPQLRLSSQQYSFRVATLNFSLIKVSSSKHQIKSIYAVFQITILSEMRLS